MRLISQRPFKNHCRVGYSVKKAVLCTFPGFFPRTFNCNELELILSRKINCLCFCCSNLIQNVIVGIVFRFPAGVKGFPRFQQRSSLGPIQPSVDGVQRIFLPVIKRLACKACFALHLVLRLSMCGAIFPRPHAIVTCTSETWPLSL